MKKSLLFLLSFLVFATTKAGIITGNSPKVIKGANSNNPNAVVNNISNCENTPLFGDYDCKEPLFQAQLEEEVGCYNRGATVRLISNQRGYVVRNLSPSELNQAVQGNYSLLKNEISAIEIYIFLTNQDFVELKNGVPLEVLGTPPSFKVLISCN
ncbi:MAG: hypothetical protein HOO06_14840 [Bdellovibrionaceae bacterium]|nr:hypothetical protein [Pseudobdellovibrionaceae bacterium]